MLSVRKRVYDGVMNKEMLWFDTQMGEDVGPGGLMVRFSRYISCFMYIQLVLTSNALNQASRPSSS